jgi:hypothetical protein
MEEKNKKENSSNCLQSRKQRPSKIATERDSLITNGNPVHKRIPLTKTDPLGHILGKVKLAVLEERALHKSE